MILEFGISLTGIAGLDRLRRLAADGRIQRDQIGYSRLGGVAPHLAAGVGHRGSDLIADHLRRVQHGHVVVRIRVGFGHLGRGVLKPHQPSPGSRRVGRRDSEYLAVGRVELARHATRELHVLTLIVSDRNQVRTVKEDVRGHQNRIVKEPNMDVLRTPPDLALELRHALKVPHGRRAVQNPQQLGVGGNVRLHEYDALFYLDAAGREESHEFKRPPAQNVRILPGRQGVKIRYHQ